MMYNLSFLLCTDFDEILIPAKDELPRESYVDIVALRKYNLDCIRCVMQHDEKLEPGHGPGPESRPGPGV